jgi:pimeloyl-ACP methyl ester carboxylesterase
MVHSVYHAARTILITGSILIGALIFSGCGEKVDPADPAQTPAPAAAATPGTLIGREPIKTYDSAAFEHIRTVDLENFFTMATMTAADFRSGFPSTYRNVALHRISYGSVIPESSNGPVTAYGLVAIPEGATNGTPVLSYQHGTVFEKENAPSNPDASIETRLALLQFASQGYIVIAADYFGNGPSSTVPNTFFLKRSMERSMFDMHTASLEFLKQQNIQPGNLFLLGWSQGGYNTMLHFRMLEQAKIPVAAVVTASGPGDPLHLITRGMFAPRPFDAPWEAAALSNVIFAYETYMGLAGCSKAFIRPDKYATARGFYDFERTIADFQNAGGAHLDSIFTPELFEAARTTSHPFWERLGETKSYLWLSTAPLRQYYSVRDEVVTPELGKAAVDYQTSIGKSNATSVDAGPNADHRSVYARALVEGKPWFDSMK